MTDPNTLSDRELARLQRAADDATGTFTQTPAQARKAATWAEQRQRSDQN